jgi:hypothetical protein
VLPWLVVDSDWCYQISPAPATLSRRLPFSRDKSTIEIHDKAILILAVHCKIVSEKSILHARMISTSLSEMGINFFAAQLEEEVMTGFPIG